MQLRTAPILILIVVATVAVAQTLSPQATAWINQEAARESALNQISLETALQAASRSGINWGRLSVRDAAGLVARAGAQQTDASLRTTLAIAQARVAATQTSRPGATPRLPGTAVQVAHSPLLDSYLASLHQSYSSLALLSAQEQLRLQVAMDQRDKFLQALSNIEKKVADSSQAVIQNLK